VTEAVYADTILARQNLERSLHAETKTSAATQKINEEKGKRRDTMTSSPIRLGIIGYGFSTKCFHLPFINALPADFKVMAFFQRSEPPKDPKAAEPGSHCTVDYPNVKHYSQKEDFFADEAIDVVIVCSRQDTHAEYATRALNAGKHGT
jgi:hypothetical protein